MANPYFQQINQQRQDFSMIADAGRAWGEAYKSIGKAIGDVGSAYFKKKAEDKKVDDYMETEDFQNKFLESGGSPFDLEQMKTDDKFRGKMRDEYIKSAGGIDKFKEQVNQKVQLNQATEKHSAQMQMFEKQTKQLELSNTEKEKAVQGQEYANQYLAHATKWKQDPNNKSKVIGAGESFIKTIGDQGGDMAIARQAVMSSNKAMGMGFHNPQIQGVMMESMKKSEIDKRKLTGLNFLDQSEKENALNKMIADSGGRIPQAQIEAMSKRLDGLVVPTGKLREVTDKSFKAQGFGSFEEDAQGIAKAKELGILIDNALVQVKNDDGTQSYQIRNSVSANISLIKLARLAQGAGVLSDRDVSRVQGSERFTDIIDRTLDKRIGNVVELTEADVSEGGLYHNLKNPDTGQLYTVDDEVEYGGASVNADDLLAMRDLLGAKKKYFDSEMRDKLPNVIREIQSQFSGLTLDDIHKGTGLGDYLDGGIHSMLESGESLSDYDVKNVKQLVRGGVNNLDDAIASGKIVAKPFEMNRLRNTFEFVNRQIEVEKTQQMLNAPSPDDVNEAFNVDGQEAPEGKNTPSRPQSALRPPPTTDEDNERNGQLASQFYGGMGTGLTALNGINKIDKNRINATSNPDSKTDINKRASTSKTKVTQADSFKNYSSAKDLRQDVQSGLKDPSKRNKLAKQFGVDSKLNDKKFKKAIEKKVEDKVQQWAKKNGIKKLGTMAVGGILTGGVATGVAIGDTIWEAYSLWDSLSENEKAVMKDKIESALTSIPSAISRAWNKPSSYHFGRTKY